MLNSDNKQSKQDYPTQLDDRLEEKISLTLSKSKYSRPRTNSPFPHIREKRKLHHMHQRARAPNFSLNDNQVTALLKPRFLEESSEREPLTPHSYK